MTPAPIRAWAIKAPSGIFLCVSDSGDKVNTMARKIMGKSARVLWEEGYRCVPVHITEAVPE